MPWRGFGGLPFFFALFGRVLTWLFVFMLIFIWVVFEFFIQVNSRVDRDGGASEGQTSMFIAIVAMISIFQVIPSLRLLRTMPLRLSTITNFLVFWPLALTSILGLAAYLAHSALFGGALDWSRYITGIASCTLVLLGLPLILRFGIGIKTLIPICLLLGVAQSMTTVSAERFDLLANWLPIVAGLIAIVAIVWRLTFKALQSPNPWRANLLKMFSMRQTM